MGYHNRGPHWRRQLEALKREICDNEAKRRLAPMTTPLPITGKNIKLLADEASRAVFKNQERMVKMHSRLIDRVRWRPDGLVSEAWSTDTAYGDCFEVLHGTELLAQDQAIIAATKAMLGGMLSWGADWVTQERVRRGRNF